MIAEMEGPTTGMMLSTPESTPMAPAYGWPTMANPTNARKPWITELITVERRYPPTERLSTATMRR